MYPYFQKTLQAAEGAADPVQIFLTQNPAFGTLIFQVTGGQGAFPIAGAEIILQKKLNDTLTLSLTAVTDESGKTRPFSLPAPGKVLSQSPNNSNVYAAYAAEISAEGYAPVKIENLPVFDGITTLQPVALSPDFGQNISVIEDTEPDL